MSERREGHSRLHVENGKIVNERGEVAGAPQPPRQVIGEATVVYDGAGNRVAATGNGTVVFFDSQDVEIGDIVSIEVVLKERKR